MRALERQHIGRALRPVLACFALVCALCLVGAPQAEAAIDYDGDIDTSWYSAGASEFTLTTTAQLAGLSQIVSDGTDSFEGKTILLGADLDLSGHNWYPIGDWYTINNTFCGTFDGQGHTITGLTIDATYADNQALFGCVRNATIENLTVYGSVTGGSTCAGIVAEASTSTLRNLTSYVNVVSMGSSSESWGEKVSYNGSAAGVVCHSFTNDGTVTYSNLVNYGSILGTAPNGTGGVMGYLVAAAEGTFNVSECANYGKVVVSAAQNVDGVEDAVGGVLGNTGDFGSYHLSNCSNSGQVSSSNLGSVGGVVGSMGGDGSTIDHSSNTGSVTNLSHQFEWPTDETPSAGGVVSRFESANGKITNSYSSGTISASTGNSGAIVGVSSLNPRTIASNNYYEEGSSTGAFNDPDTGVATDAVMSGQAVSADELASKIDDANGGVRDRDMSQYQLVQMKTTEVEEPEADADAASVDSARRLSTQAIVALLGLAGLAVGAVLELRSFKIQTPNRKRVA